MSGFTIFRKAWELLQKDAVQRTLVEVPAGHVDGGSAASKSVLADQGYFRVWISRMSLAKSREWFSTRYPSVHAFADLNFGGNTLSVASVAGPNHIGDLDKEHLDRVVSVNGLLCPLVPFSGGTVTLEVALLSVEANDAMGGFLDAMTTVTSLVSVPQLSTVLSIADKVADGARSLAGVDGNIMELGYQNTFKGDDRIPGDASGNELRSQFIVVANTPVDPRYAPDTLWFGARGLRVGDSESVAEPLTGVAWMLLQVETLDKRDDYANLGTVMTPLKEAVGALADDNEQRATRKVKEAINAALTSDDLISADKTAVAFWVKSQYAKAKEQLSVGAPGAAEGGGQGFAPSDSDSEGTTGATIEIEAPEGGTPYEPVPEVEDIVALRPEPGSEVPDVEAIV